MITFLLTSIVSSHRRSSSVGSSTGIHRLDSRRGNDGEEGSAIGRRRRRGSCNSGGFHDPALDGTGDGGDGRAASNRLAYGQSITGTDGSRRWLVSFGTIAAAGLFCFGTGLAIQLGHKVQVVGIGLLGGLGPSLGILRTTGTTSTTSTIAKAVARLLLVLDAIPGGVAGIPADGALDLDGPAPAPHGRAAEPLGTLEGPMALVGADGTVLLLLQCAVQEGQLAQLGLLVDVFSSSMTTSMSSMSLAASSSLAGSSPVISTCKGSSLPSINAVPLRPPP